MYPTKKVDVYQIVKQKMKVQVEAKGTILQNKSLVNSNLMKFFQPQSSYSF